jgi:hypothetical protein
MKPFQFQYAIGATPRGTRQRAPGLPQVVAMVAPTAVLLQVAAMVAPAAALLLATAMATPAAAQQPPAEVTPATAAPMSSPARQDANEAVGLPNLKTINRPAGIAHSTVEFNAPRTPSFHETSPNGTSITEYRDRGKPVEVQVHSNFGTRYQMSASPDMSPQVHESGKPSTRLPSVQLKY